MEVTCRCGAVMRGTRSEIIAKVQAHGWTEHHQKLTPAEVRAVWRADLPAAGGNGPKK